MKTDYQKIYDTDPNRAALKNLDKAKYPALHRLLFRQWRDRLFRTLEYFWLQQDTIANQHLHPDGYYMFWQSREHTAYEGRYISHNIRVWQRNIILLHCLGLIFTRKARYEKGKKLSEIDRKALEIMKEKGYQKPVTNYTTQLWNLDRLEYSEAQAQKWIDNRISAIYVTKEIVIRVFGQELADEVYGDTRGIPDKSAEVNEAMKQAIIKTSIKKGYTTRLKVVAQVTRTFDKYKAKKAWAVYGNDILAESGYRYHRPSKADKARYGIRANDNRWIIDKVEPASPREEKEVLAEEMNEVTNG